MGLIPLRAEDRQTSEVPLTSVSVHGAPSLPTQQTSEVPLTSVSVNGAPSLPTQQTSEAVLTRLGRYHSIHTVIPF